MDDNVLSNNGYLPKLYKKNRKNYRGEKMIKEIELGFGVSIEMINNDSAIIHNLKSNNENIMNLGVKLK